MDNPVAGEFPGYYADYMMIILIAAVVAAGLLNPWTGLFGSYYSPRRAERLPEPPEPPHRSFRLTRGR